MRFIFLLLLLVIVSGISITSISAQSQYNIPAWVKGIAGFWAEDKITDDEFGEGLAFLIDNEIIKIPIIQQLQNENAQLKSENSELRSKLILAMTETAPGGPENTGVLGSEHTHAVISVKIFGDSFDFSAPAYQIKSSWIHFEGRDGTTIHKHATGVTLGYLFETLSLGLDDQCFVFQDGRSFCSNEDYKLSFFVNGEQLPDIRELEIVEDDRILITYGAETPEEIQSQLLELNKQEILR
jgi:hypothetical protein